MAANEPAPAPGPMASTQIATVDDRPVYVVHAPGVEPAADPPDCGCRS